MKKINVINEKWFRNQPLGDVVALGVAHLGIPLTSFDGKEEIAKRALCRQRFNELVKAGHVQYKQDFEIHADENVGGNPFAPKRGVAATKKKSVPLSALTGKYAVHICRLRAGDNDKRWELWRHIVQHKDFESLLKTYKDTYGDQEFKSTGLARFTAPQFAAWALRCGWITKV